MSELTIEDLRNLNIGDSVHDMHDGLAALKLADGMAVESFVRIEADGGSQFIQNAIRKTRGDSFTYHNKIAYVTDVLYCNSARYGVTCAYSYDDRYFGMFCIVEK